MGLPAILLVAIVGKLIGTGLVAYISRINRAESTVGGFASNGRVAVELIIASVGFELGTVNDVYFSLLVVVAFFTTLILPVAPSFLLNNVAAVRDALVVRED